MENALVLKEKAPEAELLQQEVTSVEDSAMRVIINTDSDWAAAGQMTREIKRVQKEVKDFWEPLRVSTKAAYDDVLAKKKSMMGPLESAERILKNKMSNYTVEQERKRKAAEEAMKASARAEAERKLQEAAAAEAAGDFITAEFARAEADTMEGIAVSGTVKGQAPHSDGVTQTKTWKITKIDTGAVPISFDAVELRPVDERAVMRLIKESKGTIRIPGVEYEEAVTITVRT